MRILIATNSYPTKKNPTHQIFVKNIYKGLKEKYDEVGLVYNLYYRWFKSDLGTGNVFSSFLKLFALFWSFLPQFLYKVRSYDVIYSHGELLPGILIPALQKMYGIKHVCYVHGSANLFTLNKGLNYKFTRFALKRADYVITNSHFMQHILKREYQLESEIITPGYNSDIFKINNELIRDIDICFAGSAVKNKGGELLLNNISANRAFYKKNAIHIHFYTDGNQKKNFTDYLQNHNISEFATINSRLTDKKLATKLQRSKIFILPSYQESLGLIGIEAIASGCILIAANTGGIREYIKDGENGFLFEPGNEAHLQRKIEHVFNNYASIKEKFKNSHKSVEAYSLENGIIQTVDFFNSISFDH